MNKKNQLRVTRYRLWPLADIFSILLDVMARLGLGRDGQAGPIQQALSNAAMLRNVEGQ